MARLLVINPNTSRRITGTIDALVRDEVGLGSEVRTATARFGFEYIASRAAVAIAGHAVLDAAAEAITAGAKPDAIILGCFGDPGLQALEEMTDLPVAGFAEAGLLAAADEPGSFLVATRGEVWRDILRELAQRLGVEQRIADIYSLPDSGGPAEIAGDLAGLARKSGAERIVLGGAGLIPILPQIIAACPVPVLDPHRAAIRKAAQLAGQPRRDARDWRGDTTGLSPALAHALSGHSVAAARAGGAS